MTHRTDADVRFEFWWQLNEELDRLDDEYQWIEADDRLGLLERGDVTGDEEWLQPRACFEAELFRDGHLEFVANVARLHVHPLYELGDRILRIMGVPDVGWCHPNVVSCDERVRTWEPYSPHHCVVEVVLVDSWESLDDLHPGAYDHLR